MDRFSSLKFNFTKATKSLDVEFPDLFRLKEFNKLRLRRDIDWQKLVKYIILMYDPNSELIREFQELKERKDAAAVQAGFDRIGGGRWPKELIAVMEMRNEITHAAIMAFLKIFRNNDFTNIIVTEQELWEFQGLRFQAINDKTSDLYGDAKKKDGIMDSVEKRTEALKTYYSSFYGDNKDLIAPEFEEPMTPETSERILSTLPVPFEEVKEETDVPSVQGVE
jgi:hypothetical protein